MTTITIIKKIKALTSAAFEILNNSGKGDIKNQKEKTRPCSHVLRRKSGLDVRRVTLKKTSKIVYFDFIYITI